VGKINLIAPSKREVNANINPMRLETLGMGVDQVIARLQSENANTPSL
jgi:HAE1 family hydrophobic/amphiphilic exporter-1